MECILRPMVLSTMETGNMGSGTVKESTLGLMAVNMRDSSLSIKNGDMEYILRPMVLSSMENGIKGASTVLESNVQKMERSRKVNGMMTGLFNGLRNQYLNERLA